MTTVCHFFALMRTCGGGDGGVRHAVDWRNQETVLMSVCARARSTLAQSRGGAHACGGRALFVL